MTGREKEKEEKYVRNSNNIAYIYHWLFFKIRFLVLNNIYTFPYQKETFSTC
jgi:hypothetical protein